MKVKHQKGNIFFIYRETRYGLHLFIYEEEEKHGEHHRLLGGPWRRDANMEEQNKFPYVSEQVYEDVNVSYFGMFSFQVLWDVLVFSSS